MNEVAENIIEIFNKNLTYFENIKWCSFYNKYNEQHLCFKDNWNYIVSNLVSKDLTDDRAINCKKLKPFYEWLGERIELLLNLNTGLSNEELKELLENK